MLRTLKAIFARGVNPAFLFILIKKELLQISRDPSVLAVVILQPLLLVVLYCFAMRMDVKPVEIAIVTPYQSQVQRQVTDAFIGSAYFDVTVVSTLGEGRALFDSHKVKNLLYFPPDFDEALAAGKARALLYENGAQAQLAQLTQSYVSATLQGALGGAASGSQITLSSRTWYNEANDSTWFLMSGQYIAIMTLVCAFLGSFVIAREWDRGTMESLSGTSASSLEIVLSKVITYYGLGLCGSMLTVFLGQMFSGIPVRGAVAWIVALVLIYSFEMVCFGVLISAVCKNQFLASEYAIIIGALPTMLLTGMVFDLRGAAEGIRILGWLLPPTYAVEASRICFLSGGQDLTVLRDLLVQALWGIFFFICAVYRVQKDSK
ncbi:MAG: ABC transporter permease [Succinivibrio sp.]|jgi:ABC-2 type transport system permease protein|nr:ABC transporter permease [Succinivibrio sp.]